MPDPSTATAASSFYPDIEQADPKEESEANKRALTLGLLTAGIGILSHPYIKGQSVVAPIAQGLGAGLETYEGSLQEAAKDQLDRHKVALDAYKDKIAQERADAYEQHQQEIEKESLRRDDINQQRADAQDTRNTNLETDANRRFGIEQQNANTAGRRADTAAAAESARWDPAGANSPAVQRFDRYRNVPELKKYMDVAYPPETLAGMNGQDLNKADADIRRQYANATKGHTTFFTGSDGLRHMTTVDATGEAKDIPLGPVLTPGTDKDAKTKDFTEYKDGTPWTVTRNMSIPGAPAIQVQPLKGYTYHYFRGPDEIPNATDFPGLSPSVTGRIGSKPGTGTAGPASAPTGPITTTPTGKPLVSKSGKPIAIDPSTGKRHYVVNSGGDAAARGSAGGAGTGGAPGASAVPAGSPKLYTEGGIHRNKATGEYLFKMPDGSWGWGKTPNDPNPRPSAADAVKKAEEARGGAGV